MSPQQSRPQYRSHTRTSDTITCYYSKQLRSHLTHDFQPPPENTENDYPSTKHWQTLCWVRFDPILAYPSSTIWKLRWQMFCATALIYVSFIFTLLQIYTINCTAYLARLMFHLILRSSFHFPFYVASFHCDFFLANEKATPSRIYLLMTIINESYIISAKRSSYHVHGTEWSWIFGKAWRISAFQLCQFSCLNKKKQSVQHQL